MAGGRADEQARRAAQRVNRLRRHPSTAELRERLAAAERREYAWSAGAEGERLVAATLGELQAAGWILLHDVHWPGRPKANLDHVAIGPGGIVVVDAKNWSWQITVHEGVLWCESWRKDRELEAIASAVAAVAALLPPAHRSAARGVLCVVGQDIAPSSTTAGVTVVGRGQLVEHVRDLGERLTDQDVATVAELLRTALDGPVSPTLTTTAATTAPAAHHEPSPRARRGVPCTVPARRRARSRVVRVLLDALLHLAVAVVIVAVVVTVGPQLVAHVVASFLRTPG
ncbi:nuclease-related domain-containing protein [Kineococcus sp. SYSU DK003]|uniref:nuclease-related domain-containing protein n=1 Tax=Kineococcus sp. SYSU DK003 TaxID=3383124 RepID=UPI003D7F0172